MVLTDRNVVHYLAERRLLEQASLVRDHIQIRPGSGRHRNFRITRAPGAGFFIKQVKRWEPAAVETLDREAGWYELVETLPECHSLQRLMPMFCQYDEARSILVVELIENAETLLSVPAERGINSAEVAAQLGRLLAQLHAHDPRSWPLEGQRFCFPHRYPGALTLDLRTEDELTWLLPGERQVMQLLREHTEFGISLAELRECWERDCVIHCDFRWNNVLVLEQADARGPVELKLIDWELVDCGDRAWDVGGVLQSWLNTWIQSMPDEPAPAHEIVRAAAWPLETMQPAMRAFWQAYSRAAELERAGERSVLLRSVRFSAARLLQSTLEAMTQEETITARGRCRLQVALNTLSDPEAAAAELFTLG